MERNKAKNYYSEMLACFDEGIGDYELFCQTIADLINRLLISKKLTVHSISNRCKDRLSFERKIRKKGKYKELSEITDLAGIRIITHYSDDVDVVANMIEKEFQIDRVNSIDKRTVLDPDRFGYLSLHYVASLKQSRSKLQEYAAYSSMKFEVQIRSILQHTWAEIEHDIGYKNEIEVPIPIKRKFSRLAGLLELADQEFDSIRKEIDRYARVLDRQLSGEIKNVALDAMSYEKFVKGNLESLKLDSEIREACGFGETEELDLVQLSINRLISLGVSSIDKLLSSMRENRADILRMAKVMQTLPDEDEHGDEPYPMGPGIAAFFLCHVLAAQRDGEGVLSYVKENGWDEGPGAYEFIFLLENFYASV